MTEKLIDMSDNNYFVCVPFNRLSSEKGPNGEQAEDFLTSQKVKEERLWIWENIQGRENSDIVNNTKAMEKLRELGSDTNINGFALNWRYGDGTLNTDLEEANYFMKRVVDRLSITSTDTDPTKIPMYLTSTKFEPKLYGRCAQNFMERLGIQACDQDLFVLRNVVMSPWPTQRDFISELMKGFEAVVKEEVEICRERNQNGARFVEFLAQGTDEVFLSLQTSFHSATLRQQLIVAAELSPEFKQKYDDFKKENKGEPVILRSTGYIDLPLITSDLTKSGFDAKIYVKGDDLYVSSRFGKIGYELTVL